MKDPHAIYSHFWKSEPEQWAETFSVNVTGLYFTSIAFLPLLAKGGKTTPGYSSSVVNISSISGFMKGGSSGQPAYAASKAAATHLTRTLASIFAETKVRVNAICPGVFPSEVSDPQK
jgi:NAD(P)-dependent dehydrogenase (short-subunit alcohol dehydrogenase family)